jgi:hypothetical protein
MALAAVTAALAAAALVPFLMSSGCLPAKGASRSFCDPYKARVSGKKNKKYSNRAARAVRSNDPFCTMMDGRTHGHTNLSWEEKSLTGFSIQNFPDSIQMLIFQFQ